MRACAGPEGTSLAAVLRTKGACALSHCEGETVTLSHQLSHCEAVQAGAAHQDKLRSAGQAKLSHCEAVQAVWAYTVFLKLAF